MRRGKERRRNTLTATRKRAFCGGIAETVDATKPHGQNCIEPVCTGALPNPLALWRDKRRSSGAYSQPPFPDDLSPPCVGRPPLEPGAANFSELGRQFSLVSWVVIVI